MQAGTLLFHIDPATYEAQVALARAQVLQAQAQLGQARRTEARARQLAQSGASSQATLEDAASSRELAEAQVAAAEAQLQTATLSLDYATVEAPVAGVTSLEQVPEGSLLSTGDLLTRISRLDPVYVNFSAADKEAASIRELVESGQLQGASSPSDLTVTLMFGDGETYGQTGTIDFTSTTINSQTGTILSRAVLPNPDSRLLPGQFVRLQLEGLSIEDAIELPTEALMQGPQGTFVYTLNDENVAEVQPGRRRPRARRLHRHLRGPLPMATRSSSRASSRFARVPRSIRSRQPRRPMPTRNRAETDRICARMRPPPRRPLTAEASEPVAAEPAAAHDRPTATRRMASSRVRSSVPSTRRTTRSLPMPEARRRNRPHGCPAGAADRPARWCRRPSRHQRRRRVGGVRPMNARFFVDRPIFAAVISILITLGGLLSISALPIEQYPQLVPPQVQVRATYPGASAETIAQTVSAPIEQQINGVEDMLYMQSTNSSTGTATITVTFASGTDPDQATINVNNRVQQANASLPRRCSASA